MPDGFDEAAACEKLTVLLYRGLPEASNRRDGADVRARAIRLQVCVCTILTPTR